VAERTAEARAAQAAAEQRAAELAVINSIQQGIAGKLDFQGIVKLVGDKLCEVLHTSDDIGITLDRARARAPALPVRVRTRSNAWTCRHVPNEIARHRARPPKVLNTPESSWPWPAADSGHRQASPMVSVHGRGRPCVGASTLENHEREHAFSDSDVRLLRPSPPAWAWRCRTRLLFEDIQRRTRESAALAEVGRDISSTLDLPVVMDRIAHHAKSLLGGDNSAIFVPAEGGVFRAIVAVGDIAEQRQRGQERLPGHHEPRDPHADERRDRHERAAAGHAARRRAARLRQHHPRQRRRAADHHQRHPRLLEDRGRAHGHRGASPSTCASASRARSTSSAAAPPRSGWTWPTCSTRGDVPRPSTAT
jgi:hypothetical protein